MKNIISWNKGLFKCYFNFLSGNKIIGRLKDNALSGYSTGELNGLAYRFVTKGIFKKRTELVDLSTDMVVANISFNCWSPGAMINYKGESLNWSFKNIFETKWQIFNATDPKIHSSGNLFNGQIEMLNADELLAFVGLYITNYYRQLITLLLAIILPSALVIFM